VRYEHWQLRDSGRTAVRETGSTQPLQRGRVEEAAPEAREHHNCYRPAIQSLPSPIRVEEAAPEAREYHSCYRPAIQTLPSPIRPRERQKQARKG